MINLKNYIPYSKNPKIAKVFREIGLADELGSGVRNITKYTKIYSGKEPILEDGEIFRAIIPLSKEKDEQQEKAQENAQETHKKHTRNAQEDFILEFCNEAKSLKEILEHCGYKNARSFREKYINPLLKAGKLKMTMPEQPKNRNQKYISNL